MSDDLTKTPLYMVALRLDGRRALVVGGGPIAQDKVDRLLVCGARITLVAPEAIAGLRDLAAEGSIDWERRPYASADLAGTFVAVAATDDADINTRVSADAQGRGVLVNVVDVPALSTFIVPAVTRHGPIAIAVSTAGASPALAKRMRTEIANRFGEPYARLAGMLNEIRGWAKETLPTYSDRKEFFEGIVNGTPDPIELLRAGREADVVALIAAARARADELFATSG